MFPLFCTCKQCCLEQPHASGDFRWASGWAPGGGKASVMWLSEPLPLSLSLCPCPQALALVPPGACPGLRSQCLRLRMPHCLPLASQCFHLNFSNEVSVFFHRFDVFLCIFLGPFNMYIRIFMSFCVSCLFMFFSHLFSIRPWFCVLLFLRGFCVTEMPVLGGSCCVSPSLAFDCGFMFCLHVSSLLPGSCPRRYTRTPAVPVCREHFLAALRGHFPADFSTGMS